MEYFNEFHKQTTERCLKYIAASKNLKLDAEKEAQHIREMHRQIAERYPNESR